MARGKKICKSCNTEQGVRSLVCQCGFDFVEDKRKRDFQNRELKQQKEEKKQLKDKIKREEKEKKQEEKEAKKQQKNPIVENKNFFIPPDYEKTDKLSSKENAERILSYGKERARSLLNQSRLSKTWNHVDWKIVEEGVR